MSKSGVQRQVMALFKAFLQEVRKKPIENRPQLLDVIYARFRKDASIPKSNFAAIEYQLDLGRRRLEEFKKGRITTGVMRSIPSSTSHSTGYGPPS